MDGLAFLEEEDTFRLMVMNLLISRTMELKDEWNERLAISIVNQMGKANRG